MNRLRLVLAAAATATATLAVTAPRPVDAAGHSLVITLGDSYASGTGIHETSAGYDQAGGGSGPPPLTGRQDGECWREDDSSAGPLVATTLGAPSTFLACKGAETSHISNQFGVAVGRHADRRASGWADTLILVTAGGNDVRAGLGQTWPDVIENCMLVVNCISSDNAIANITTVQTSVSNLLGTIVAEAPKATIRLIGYPYVMKPNPDCDDLNGMGVGISTAEARFIDSQADLLNAALLGTVAAARAASNQSVDVQFVDVRPFFQSGACDGGHINGLITTWPLKVSDASFHPTQTGYGAISHAILHSIGFRFAPHPVPGGCPPDPDELSTDGSGDRTGTDGRAPTTDGYSDVLDSTPPSAAGDSALVQTHENEPEPAITEAEDVPSQPPYDEAPAPCED